MAGDKRESRRLGVRGNPQIIIADYLAPGLQGSADYTSLQSP